MNNESVKYPKLLILCHNIYENTNNIGKTLISLLDFWPKEKLCEVYLRNEVPSFEHCYDYYRILDKEILKSYIKGKSIVGRSFKKDINTSINDCNDRERNLYNLGNKRIPLVSLCRDLLWKKKSWKNSSFDKWLDEQKPEVILFVPNDYSLIYPIAKYIIKKCNIPLIPYYMDDAFYYGTFVSPIDYIRRISIRKKAKPLLQNASKIITIGPKMAEVYCKKFGKDCINLMNSVQIKECLPKENKKVIVMSYVGNLHSNRWKSIVEIGKTLDYLNREVILQVYSPSFVSEKMNKAFSNVKSIHFMGRVMPDEVEKVLINSDILLFVESFIRKSKASTKYSLSTKIPEYLNAYRCIFAYGPSDISSIEYLKNNNLAITCTSKTNLVSALEKVLEFRNKIDVEEIQAFVRENHCIEKNRRIIEQIIFEEVKK